MNYTFGPIPSRRFGMSLGIDLSSNIKQCNFDCLYCELAPAKTVDKQSISIDPDTILTEVKNSLEKHPNIDVITLTANGEPTLYPYLKELISKLNGIKGEKKLLILSNGANIYDQNIQDILLDIDIVKLSLDCVSEKCFKKLDRAHQNVSIESIINGLVEFRNKFDKTLVLETLFVKDLNDSSKEIDLLIEAYEKIKPNRIDLGTIDRPPAYDVQPISYDTLESVANRCKNLPVTIAYKNRPSSLQSFTEDEIINLLKMRPLTKEDIENTFDLSSKIILNQLIEKKIIQEQIIGGVNFYKNV